MFGYHGRYLRVDLTTEDVVEVALPADVLQNFIGGVGLGTWLLLNEGQPLSDPLASEAPLIFAFSPLVGSPLTTSAKFAVMAKSPLTQRINDSLSSSSFAIAGKKTGYDAFVIVGAASNPTCLVIEPTGCRFVAADECWGQSSERAADLLREQLGKQFRVASIGVAGENLVRFATVSHEGRHAARGGLGAVMGSKRLKAVAVAGDRTVEYAHPHKLVDYSRELSRKSFGPATAKYRELGTATNLLTFNRLGTLPTRNFQASTFEHAEDLSPEAMLTTHSRTRASCAACTIGCEHLYSDPESPDAAVRIEYENLFALGPLCGVSDPDAVLQASRLCDELGLDTISAGATIAFAMECAERGLIDADHLRFGDAQALHQTLRSIATRQGLGELLSHGTRSASREIGQGSEDFAPHVKGLEIPGYEPRALQTMALGFAVTARGADHNRSGAYQVDFSESVDRLHASPAMIPPAIETENEASLFDSLILCKFLRGVFDDKFMAMAEMLRLTAGWDVSPDELHRTAERIVTAKKVYNIWQGWSPDEDMLPKRFLTEQLPDGTGFGATIDESQLRQLVCEYNRARGWSDEGWIPNNQLKVLQIPIPQDYPSLEGSSSATS